jgi:hypothetical protein
MVPFTLSPEQICKCSSNNNEFLVPISLFAVFCGRDLGHEIELF